MTSLVCSTSCATRKSDGMSRVARFNEAKILDVTADIIAAGGPGAATIAAIGHRLGAPSGSIYHRFPSRSALLGRLWMQKAAQFQDRFVAALAHDEPYAAGLEAALSFPRSVRSDPAGAKILLLYRREDFLDDAWPPAIQEEAKRLGDQVTYALAAITKRLFDRAGAADRRAVTFAILDAPMAGVRRHVMANEAPPATVDKLLRVTFEAVIRPRLADRGLTKRDTPRATPRGIA